MIPRVRLGIAAALFVGWMCWLGFAALTKSRAPVVSRAQAAGASAPVLVELTTGEDGKGVFLLRPAPFPPVTELKEKADRPAIVVTVVESFVPGGPEKGTEIGVINLPSCAGYKGPGRYLLLLNKDEVAKIEKHEKHPAYTLAGQQSSPGADLAGVGPPVIYPWSDQTDADMRKQVKKLFP